MKLNPNDNIEIVTIKVTKDKYPILYTNKVNELVEEGMTKDEAEKVAEGMEVDLELYYEKSYGFFAVESEAIESGCNIYSPYTSELCEN